MKYCDDPVNYSKCSQYAKEKGFYKNDPVIAADDTFWQKTKNQLGCDTQNACETFCQQSTNYEKCDSFAKTNNLVGGYVDDPGKYIEKAKESLGCDSASSCSTFCDNAANKEKCTTFANQVGLLGGETTQGPSGC